MVETLDTVPGQERAVSLLRRYLAAGTTPSGLLFAGEEGVGKEKTARAFVSALLGRAPGAGGACGACPVCRLLASGGHPNLLRIVPETHFLRIDEIRALKEELSLKAFSDRPRAAVPVPADRMTPQAANALLKTLEQPPPGTHLLLVAHRVSQVMPTIVSRCQRIPFFPLPAERTAGDRRAGCLGTNPRRNRDLRGRSVRETPASERRADVAGRVLGRHRSDPGGRVSGNLSISGHDFRGDARRHDFSAGGGRILIPGGHPDDVRATAYEAFDLYHSGHVADENWTEFGIGFIVSAVVAFVAVKWLLRYVQTYSFTPFGWYRIALGLVLVATTD